MMRLDGTRVFLAGDFSEETSESLREALEERGAEVSESIAPDVEVVFAGESPGSEVDAARELGIRVEDEEALRAALDGGDPEEKPPPPDEVIVEDEEFPPVEINAISRPSDEDVSSTDETPGDARKAGERVFEKGARVKIVGGTDGVGEVGEIFWWGESKYGPGMRAGVSTPADQTFWVDEENLGWPDDDVPDDVKEAAKKAAAFSRGDRVEVVTGKNAGHVGDIFWWGESKYGPGMRAGVETDSGDKIWVDAEHLEVAEDDAAGSKGGDLQFPDDDIPF